MEDATLAPVSPGRSSSLVDKLDHRVAVGAVSGTVIAALVAFDAGGNVLVLMFGALLLGIAGLAAAAL